MNETSNSQVADRNEMMPAAERFPLPLLLLFFWVINVGLYLYYFSAFGIAQLQKVAGN